MKLSLCMIVRDEEEVLGRCLTSVHGLFDELVIVDTGSRDRTEEIALSHRAKVLRFRWRDDFAAARNFSFAAASGDYVCWLDADDVLPEESRARFPSLRLLLEREAPDLVYCPYRTGELVFGRERFFRREAGFCWEGRVHECVAPHGKIARVPLTVLHLQSAKPRGTRNLDIYEAWAREEPLSGRDLFYYGRELSYHGRYEEACARLKEMLAGEGWYVNKIEACRVLAACLRAMGRREEAAAALLRSFSYGEPRAGALCELGKLCAEKGDARAAVFWYRSALLARDHSAEGDFEEPACRSVLPLLELVVLFWRLGEKENAKACHLRVKELAPEHPSVLYNERFFS